MCGKGYEKHILINIIKYTLLGYCFLGKSALYFGGFIKSSWGPYRGKEYVFWTKTR